MIGRLPGVRPREVLRLAAESLIRMRIRSGVTVVIVALASAAVVLTTGRSAAAREAIIERLNAPEVRLIRLIDRTGGADMRPNALQRIRALGSVEWAIALGPVGQLGRNAGLVESRGAVHTGEAVGIRSLWGSIVDSPIARLHDGRAAQAGEAVVGSTAFRSLGLASPAGAIATAGQASIPVVGHARFASGLEDLNSYALVRRQDGHPSVVSEFVVLAASASTVEPLVAVLPSVIAARDVSALGIERAAELLRVRDELGREVDELNTAVLIGSLLGSSALVAVNLFGAIAERRREYGLRRTQGATRSTIAALVLLEVAALAVVGAVTGVTGATAWVARDTGLILDPLLLAAITALLVVSSLLGALPAALAAAYREPLYALR